MSSAGIGRLKAFYRAASKLEGTEADRRFAFLFTLLKAAILAVPILISLLVISPFFDIRFRPIYADRLGHLVLETDIFISQLKKESPKAKVVCFFVGRPANSYFSSLVRRKFNVVSPVFGATGYLLQRSFFRRSASRLSESLHQTRHVLTAQSLWVSDNFSPGCVESLLDRLGVDSQAPYVCLWVRDSVFGTLAMPGRDQYFAGYRDASIANYHRMCRTLQSLGYSVIRMGRTGITESGNDDVPYVDYLSSPLNSEENDFLLAKYCLFAVCGDSGSTAIPLLYRKPIALTNVGSFFGAITAESVRMITMKRIEWVETGEAVTSSEIRRFGIHRFNDRDQFDSLGIRHVENTDLQLEGIALEMLHLLRDEADAMAGALTELQAKFLEKVRPLVGEEPSFLGGKVWLQENPQFAL